MSAPRRTNVFPGTTLLLAIAALGVLEAARVAAVVLLQDPLGKANTPGSAVFTDPPSIHEAIEGGIDAGPVRVGDLPGRLVQTGQRHPQLIGGELAVTVPVGLGRSEEQDPGAKIAAVRLRPREFPDGVLTERNPLPACAPDMTAKVDPLPPTPRRRIVSTDESVTRRGCHRVRHSAAAPGPGDVPRLLHVTEQKLPPPLKNPLRGRRQYPHSRTPSRTTGRTISDVVTRHPLRRT